MIVEGAERYGLSQLHQLRGRVGRGVHESQCILFGDARSDGARARLEAIESERDGFKLAEVDLSIRGEGEILGTRQHGLPRFRAAELPEDMALLLEARRRVLELISAARLAGGSCPRSADGRGSPAIRRRAGRAARGVVGTVMLGCGSAAASFAGGGCARPRGAGVRPTTERVREALFSILGEVDGLEVLDLYCGTGALGIEALSRGAARATLVDTDVADRRRERRASSISASRADGRSARRRSATSAAPSGDASISSSAIRPINSPTALAPISNHSSTAASPRTVAW